MCPCPCCPTRVKDYEIRPEDVVRVCVFGAVRGTAEAILVGATD